LPVKPKGDVHQWTDPLILTQQSAQVNPHL